MTEMKAPGRGQDKQRRSTSRALASRYVAGAQQPVPDPSNRGLRGDLATPRTHLCCHVGRGTGYASQTYQLIRVSRQIATTDLRHLALSRTRISDQRKCRRYAELEGKVVGGVSAWGLGGVDPAGWSPVRDPVGHLAGPAAFAVFAVVKSADESEIVQVGAATVDPRGDVVGFAPIRGPITARETNSRRRGRRGLGVARCWRCGGSARSRAPRRRHRGRRARCRPRRRSAAPAAR